MPEKQQFVHNCVLVRSHVIDIGDKPVRSLSPGGSYGHAIELVRNLALWPLEFLVRTKVKDTRQLQYRNTNRPREWAFKTRLHPNHGDKQVALLECVGKKSGKDELFTTLSSDAGYVDTLTLEIKID